MRPQIKILLTILFLFTGYSSTVTAQAMDDPAIKYLKNFFIEVNNPLNIERKHEPVTILIKDIISKFPDFNKMFFRVKYYDSPFEPSDIPSQIRMAPEAGTDKDELVFQIDIAPNATITIEVQYNPHGALLPEYPVKTLSSDTWYRPGENLSWESELIAYRSYNGVVDFFAKTYSHTRLNNLLPDSYHHERIWGIDPYMIGGKPGLGGVIIFQKDKIIKAYGENAGKITFKASGNGAVSSGGLVKGSFFHHYYWIFTDCFENRVKTYADFGNNVPNTDILIAPGVQKFDNAEIIKNDKEGYLIVWGSPLTEYGIIGTALIWNPEKSSGLYEDEDGIFIKLRTDNDYSVDYESIGVWNRASSKLPDSPGQFENYVKVLAEKFINPLSVKIK